MLFVYLSLLETEEQKDKFEYIYTNYCAYMFIVAKDAVRDQYNAEDIVHETFLELVRIIDSVRVSNEKELKGFLWILTRHKAVDFLRKNGRIQPADDEALENCIDSNRPDPEMIALDNLQYEKLVSKMIALKEIYQTPLMLRVKGYKIDEIAHMLDLSAETVKVRLFRARKMLLSELEASHEE